MATPLTEEVLVKLMSPSLTQSLIAPDERAAMPPRMTDDACAALRLMLMLERLMTLLILPLLSMTTGAKTFSSGVKDPLRVKFLIVPLFLANSGAPGLDTV